MTKKKKDVSLSSKVEAAFRQAASKVVQRARQTGTPVVVWEEGRVKEIPADQLEIKTDSAKANDSES
jgi:DhnA family fructose-bisphosphate aldolase class Ia